VIAYAARRLKEEERDRELFVDVFLCSIGFGLRYFRIMLL
jgi:hypothetical protein